MNPTGFDPTRPQPANTQEAPFDDAQAIRKMTTPTNDPEIEQEAELENAALAECVRIMDRIYNEAFSANSAARTPVSDILLPVFRELATLRRKAASPLPDKLREIEERAAKATKGSATEPLPCPFCGSPAKVYGTQKSEQFGVGCSTHKCGITTLGPHRDTIADAIAVWNCRSTADALADIDTLLAALRSRGGEGERKR